MMQGQAGRWLRALHATQGLVVLDPQMTDLVRQLESAIQYGRPVIIQVFALAAAMLLIDGLSQSPVDIAS